MPIGDRKESKMKLIKNWNKVIIGLFLLAALNLSAKAHTYEKENIDTWLEQLNDHDWTIRATASFGLYCSIKELEDEEIVEKIKTALINLLAKDILLKDAGQLKSTTPEESAAEYLAELAENVATFKDPRSIPSLMRHMTIRSVMNTLVEFGDPVVELLLKEIENRDIPNKGVPVKVLGEMVRPKEKGYVAKGKMREKIKQTLIKTLKESKHPTDKTIEWYEIRARQRASVRLRVIRALENIADTDVITIIKKITNEDPYFQDFSKKKNYTGSKKRYEVREEAQKVLDKLKKEGKIKK